MQLRLQLPADIHRDLTRYAEQLARDSDLPAVEPSRLIAPMLVRFMRSDRRRLDVELALDDLLAGLADAVGGAGAQRLDQAVMELAKGSPRRGACYDWARQRIPTMSNRITDPRQKAEIAGRGKAA